MPLLGPDAVNLALDGGDLVDAANRLDRQWHLPQLGQHKELAPAVGPARRFGDPAGSSPGVVEIIEAGIGSYGRSKGSWRRTAPGRSSITAAAGRAGSLG
jgi:hypothetical protein